MNVNAYLSQVGLSSLGQPVGISNFTYETCSNIALKTLPQAIRATAGLLYWFAKEAEILPSPSLTVSPTTYNVGSGRSGTYFDGSFKITNTGNVNLNLTIQSPIWGVNLEGQDPNHIVSKFLMPGWMVTIFYTGSFGAHNYGPFTETVTIDDNDNNIHKTHSITGTLLLPDFCFGETHSMSLSPEEQVFDKEFIGYFPISNDSLDIFKNKSIKERLNFAYKLLKKDKNEKVEDICKTIINTYPESEMGLSFYAMGLLWEAAYSDEAPDFKETDFKKYLTELTFRKEKYKIYGYAQLILSLLDVGNDIEGFEKLFSDYKYGRLKELALFHQFIHYYKYEQNKDKAKQISDKLDALFISSRYGYQAHLIMGDEGYTLKGLMKLVEKEQTSFVAKSAAVNSTLLVEMPSEYKLYNNYPNPFNPNTTIKFSIPKISNVKIIIYNILGQSIKTLVNEVKAPGVYSVEWNGTNENSINVTSGIYFYRLESNEFAAINKMILLR